MREKKNKEKKKEKSGEGKKGNDNARDLLIDWIRRKIDRENKGGLDWNFSNLTKTHTQTQTQNTKHSSRSRSCCVVLISLSFVCVSLSNCLVLLDSLSRSEGSLSFCF